MAAPSPAERAYQPPAPFATIECQLDLADATPSSVTKQGTYSWYGSLDVDSLAQSAGAFIASNSTPASTAAASVHGRALARFLAAAAADAAAIAPPAARGAATQACWLAVRMSGPTDEFATPRWHRDGVMFACSCVGPGGGGDGRHHAKYAVALLGPPTRLMRPSAALDAAVAEFAAAGDDDEDAARLRGQDGGGAGEVALWSPRQVIRFSWGQADSPVHSEPDWGSSDRIFVSVLFGSEEELRDMCDFRGETYGVVSV